MIPGVRRQKRVLYESDVVIVNLHGHVADHDREFLLRAMKASDATGLSQMGNIDKILFLERGNMGPSSFRQSRLLSPASQDLFQI